MSDAWAVLLAALGGGGLSIGATLIAQHHAGKREAASAAAAREERSREWEATALREMQEALTAWLEDCINSSALDIGAMDAVSPVHDPRQGRYPLAHHVLRLRWLCERVRDVGVRDAVDKFIDEGLHTLPEMPGPDSRQRFEAGVEQLVQKHAEVQGVIGERLRQVM